MSNSSAAYAAAISTAAAFDRSASGTISLIGPDAVQFLHNLCTNDVKSLPVGGGCEAYLCDPRAKVQHQFWVSRVADGLWLETVPGRAQALFQSLDRYLISERIELTNATDDYVQYHVAGPNAKQAIESAIGGSLPNLTEFQHVLHEGDRIRRRNVLGVEGYDVICPKDRGPIWKQRLEKAGVVFGTDVDYETLRIEAGSPEFGKDIDDARFVMEVANAARAVSYAKGCFPGQEPIVMSRDRAGFVNRAFLGMKVLSGGPLAPGTKLTRDGAEVGIVTSSIDSPRLGAPVALGYIRRGHQDLGTKLDAAGQAVELLGYPPIPVSAVIR